ncbi:MAG TPA: [FeFe] hydrogenase, group A [Candidatus Moranbacteria bacterium]|nr:[FeFe] hydrogenase, group A [Candidatus Moranbacteria bacterium]HRZ33617.1 [FeFe] hydrogenase, group A [Candidatus Moranbacteria bacterium]
MDKLKIYINNKELEFNEGDTVLKVAKKNGIFIPALCYHSDLKPHESCRLCMVEVEGDKNLKTACSLVAKPGMKIFTDTPLVQKTVKINLELLLAQHDDDCEKCKRMSSCNLHYISEKYNPDIKKHSNRKKKLPRFQFGPSIILDQKKCINCENCLEMCAKQTNGGFLATKEKKLDFEITPSKEKNRDCIYCGQCIVHCPTGALYEVEDYQKVKKLLLEKKKKVVFQFAPSIRVSIGEEFGMLPGEVVTQKIFSALKKIGAYKVFDTSFGADVTIMEESEELIKKIINNKKEVMFSSCCPAWVKYVEFYEKDFVGNLTSVRSPQAILGGLIKTYWAEKEKINSKEIIVVSIMPCTAKKFEITRKELKVNGLYPIDITITNREFAKLLKEFNIDFPNIEPSEEDNDVMGTFTGAGEIFGASGGVLEAAIRTAYAKITGKSLENLEFKEIHEFAGIKELELTLEGKKLRFAAVNGIENVKKILAEIKKYPEKYNCVEIMACPGGCIAGGGQPLPVDDEIRKARINGLYQADRKNKRRESHKDPSIEILYKGFLANEKNRKKICHTHFALRRKGKIKKLCL